MVLQRIEAAMARLEAVARRLRREPATENTTDAAPELARLQASNARLREAVSVSLRQIDECIARHGAEPQP